MGVNKCASRRDMNLVLKVLTQYSWSQSLDMALSLWAPHFLSLPHTVQGFPAPSDNQAPCVSGGEFILSPKLGWGALGILPSFSWILPLPADNNLASPAPSRLMGAALVIPWRSPFSSGDLRISDPLYSSLLTLDSDICADGRMEGSWVILPSLTQGAAESLAPSCVMMKMV